MLIEPKATNHKIDIHGDVANNHQVTISSHNPPSLNPSGDGASVVLILERYLADKDAQIKFLTEQLSEANRMIQTLMGKLPNTTN